MKKLIVALAAIAALASCSNEEVIELNRREIAFGEVFYENPAREFNGSYSSAMELDSFYLYGNTRESENGVQSIYEATLVERNGAAYGTPWSCGVAHYWAPNAEYSFAAVAGAEAVATNEDKWPTDLTYTVSDGGADLLYAETKAYTNDAADAYADSGHTNSISLVGFSMNHLLSKVYFCLTNGFSSDIYQYRVVGIAIDGVADKGTYSTSTGKWSRVGDGELNLDFGLVYGGGVLTAGDSANSTKYQLVLPLEEVQEVNITIAYEVLVKNVSSEVYRKISDVTFSKSLTHTFEQNKTYKINATISAPDDEIELVVSDVSGWGVENNI